MSNYYNKDIPQERVDEIYKLCADEDKGLLDYSYLNPDPNYDRTHFVILSQLDYWFSLGYGYDNKLCFSGNVYNWSNAFNCNPRYTDAFKMIRLQNTIAPGQEVSIINLLKSYPNKLFLTKSEHESFIYMNKDKDIDGEPIIPRTLYWWFFPEEDPNHCIIIKYKDCSELKVLQRLGRINRSGGHNDSSE